MSSPVSGAISDIYYTYCVGERRALHEGWERAGWEGTIDPKLEGGRARPGVGSHLYVFLWWREAALHAVSMAPVLHIMSCDVSFDGCEERWRERREASIAFRAGY